MYQDQPSPIPASFRREASPLRREFRIIRSPRLRFRALPTQDGWRRVQPDRASLSLVDFLRSSQARSSPKVGHLLCVIAHIHFPETQLCCVRCVAWLMLREVVGSPPALLLDRG